MKYINKILIITMMLTLTLASCSKEKFPDKNDIIGSWVEITSNSNKTQLTFKDNGIAYLTKVNQPVDTFNYSLNDTKELLNFSNDAGESNHNIELNKKTDEITIWNLFSSIPENTSETTFEKK